MFYFIYTSYNEMNKSKIAIFSNNNGEYTLSNGNIKGILMLFRVIPHQWRLDFSVPISMGTTRIAIFLSSLLATVFLTTSLANSQDFERVWTVHDGETVGHQSLSYNEGLVEAGGRIESQVGVLVTGAARVINRGTIDTTGWGIFSSVSTDEIFYLINEGTLFGEERGLNSIRSGTVHLDNSGQISGFTGTGLEGTLTGRNTGLIEGTGGMACMQNLYPVSSMKREYLENQMAYSPLSSKIFLTQARLSVPKMPAFT